MTLLAIQRPGSGQETGKSELSHQRNEEGVSVTKMVTLFNVKQSCVYRR